MAMKRVMAAAAGVAGVGLVGAGQARGVVVDAFSDKVNTVWPFVSTSVTDFYPTLADPGATGLYGTSRITGLRASALAGGGDSVTADIDEAAGVFTYDSTDGAAGAFTLTYIQFPAPIDLIAEAVEIEFLDAPAGVFVQLGATIEWNDLPDSVAWFAGTTSGGPEVLRLTPNDPFGHGSRAEDADDATRIDFEITVPTGGDITIAEIRTVPVPEPATATLLALAGGAGLLRRR